MIFFQNRLELTDDNGQRWRSRFLQTCQGTGYLYGQKAIACALDGLEEVLCSMFVYTAWHDPPWFSAHFHNPAPEIEHFEFFYLFVLFEKVGSENHVFEKDGFSL